MNEHVTAVVDGFARLTPDEQTAAYLEIEAAWKASPDEPEAAPKPPPPIAQPAAPVQGVSLVLSVLADRIKRDPKPLLGALAALVLVRALRRRGRAR